MNERIMPRDKPALNQIATADLTGCASIAEMAAREGWEDDADGYAMELSNYTKEVATPLDLSRERLAALGAVGALADQASAYSGDRDR